jgi:hypothetical protein
MKRKIFQWIFTCLVVVGLAACNKPQVKGNPAPLSAEVPSIPQSIVRAWFDFPANGMELKLKKYDLISHVTDAAGISQIEWRVNGEMVATEPLANAADTTEKLSEFHYQWEPNQPGDYVIQVRAQSASGGWGMPAEVKIKVLGDVTSTPTLTFTPTPTETTTATVTPTVDSQLALVDAAKSGAQFSTGSCTPNSLTFSIRATQPKAVSYMFLFFKLQDKESGEQTASNGGAPMTKSGADKWTITVRGSDIKDNNRFDESWFVYQFIAQGGNDVIARSKQLSDVTFTACGSAPPAVLPEPIIITPTLRPPIFVPWE